MGAAATSACVRTATHEDLPAVVTAVEDLLRELGSDPPPTEEMLQVARTLLEDPRRGVLLIATTETEPVAETNSDPETEPAIVGVLGASYQLALHVPGRYALIQDLWVHPAWRSRSVGRALLVGLFELACEQGMVRAEVGLPRESFASIEATERFYARNGFEHLGPRMRRVFA